jgi:uncharacterized membrane protein
LRPGRERLITLSAAAAAAAVLYVLLPADLPKEVRAVAAWDAGVLVILGRWWTGILRSSPSRARHRAAADDPGRYAVFVIALVAGFITLAVATILLSKKGTLPPVQDRLLLAVVVVAVAGAWVLTQTAFTLRYAHLYYRDAGAPGGLTFAGGPPDDLDFAYFAFTIGMTFQTSDVTVNRRPMRHLLLIHAVLSFFYNTVILALAINILVGHLQ